MTTATTCTLTAAGAILPATHLPTDRRQMTAKLAIAYAFQVSNNKLSGRFAFASVRTARRILTAAPLVAS